MNDLADHESPSPRADIGLDRQAEFRIEAPWGFKILLRLVNPGSPESVAATMLIVVLTACIPSGLLGAFGRLAGVPALPLLAAVGGLFACVFATCTTLVIRAGQQSHSVPRHLRPAFRLSVIEDQAYQAVPPRTHKAIQNGNGTRKGLAGNKKRPAKPDR